MTIMPQNIHAAAQIPVASVQSASGHGPEISTRRIPAPTQTVIQDDSLAVMRSLPDGSIDAIMTSPPYNIGLNYGSYHDKLPRADYLDWMAEHAAEFARLLREDGSAFLNLGTSARDS